MNDFMQFAGKTSVEIAQNLIGEELISRATSGIIVETEAYPGKNDPACHYNDKPTKRGRIFEKGPGTIYIFSMHGHNCMNFICGTEDYPEGVLIRALKPVDGRNKMVQRRGRSENIADGPGKLTQAMNISREFNGLSLTESPLEMEEYEDPEIVADRRIGISKAKEWPLRFCKKGSDHLSETLDEPVSPEKSIRFRRENLQKSRGR